MGMHAAAIKAATARRREMNRDIVLYSSGCGWAQNQAYLRGRPTTIPRHRHVSNAATSICSGASKLCGASMHQGLPPNARGHSRQLLLHGGPPWGILPPRAALVGARVWWWRIREEVCMERCARLHRFGVLFSLSLCLYAGNCGSIQAAATATAQPQPSQSVPAPPLPSETRSTQSSPRQQTRPPGYVLTQERYEKSVRYSRASYSLYFAAVFLSLLALVILLRLGIPAKFRDWAESVSDKRWLQALVFVPLLVLTLDAVDLPLRLYGHVLSLRYEMSVQRWGSWFADWSKEQFLMAAFALILALILSVVIRRSPRRWWLYFWLVSLPVLLFVVFISPWFIDPLFNTFEPLAAAHPDLVSAIEKLTRHAGVPIPPDRMFLMKASEKTNAVNAYVTGLGASKRVVVWDTTLQKATTNETLFIVGHELGHYVLGHVWKGFLFAAALLLIGFYALFRGLHYALGRWGG